MKRSCQHGMIRVLISGSLLIFAGMVASAQANGPAAVAIRSAATSPRPGDMIRLVVAREKELTVDGLVDARGEITLPRLGTLRVTSISARDLEDSVRTLYSAFLRHPDVTVRVQRRIVISGEIMKAGEYYLDASQSLPDLIALAGGFGKDARTSSVEIVRDGVRLNADSRTYGSVAELDLRSGDHVYVATKPWIVRNAIPLFSSAIVLLSVVLSARK